MARVTVEDCIKHISNRFDLVLTAADRARSLDRGAESTLTKSGEKNTVTALREIADGIDVTDQQPVSEEE